MFINNLDEKKEPIKIHGTVEIITFFNKENGYAVLKVHPTFGYDGAEDLVTVICNTPSVQKGEELEITGEYIYHKKYGLQIKAENVETLLPNTPYGIYSLLAGGFLPGVGKSTAKKMIEAFGTDLFDIIEQHPEALKKIKGLTKLKIGKIVEAYNEKKDVKNILTFCATYGISNNKALKIYDKHKGNSIKVIQQNPYSLTNIDGFGFSIVDELAKKFGITNEDENRIKYGALYLLKTKINAGMGHCGFPKDAFLEAMMKELNVDHQLCEKVLNDMIADKKENRIVVSDIEGIPFVFNSYLANAERLLANYLIQIKECKESTVVLPPDIIVAIANAEKNNDDRTLAPSQKEAVIRTLNSKISVITGGPGVGKTTLIKILLNIYESMKNDVVLAAPTGRASKRMKEATGHNASTIHRLLEVDRSHGGFKRNEENPLEGDIFIFDESSMIDTALMTSLVRAIPKTASVIFVGDVDQLPSVGAGQVLSDLINSQAFTVSKLTEIFRQEKISKIITNAHNVNNGRMPDLTNDITSDFFYVKADEPDICANMIVKMIKKNIPNRWHFDPVNDIQVLCPMKSSGCGTEALNKRLQEELNPYMATIIKKDRLKDLPFNTLTLEDRQFLQDNEKDIPIIRGKVRAFTIHDKVMQIKNDYDKGVFNGDVGFIDSINIHKSEVTIAFPEEDTSKLVTYNFKELNEIILAYACTVHKSQGSEYPVVILPIMNQHYMMLQRKLLYTGITRGKKLVILIGQPEAIHRAVIGKKNEFHRYTKLKTWLEMLKNGMKVSYKPMYRLKDI